MNQLHRLRDGTYVKGPFRLRVELFKDLLRRAVADESTGLRLDDLVFLCVALSGAGRRPN